MPDFKPEVKICMHNASGHNYMNSSVRSL